jgi:hypothetical protein
LTNFRQDIPEALREVVMIAVRREPSERFANALELAEALRWSREQAPPIEPGERGAWALEPRSRSRSPDPPPPPPAAQEPGTAPDGAIEAQSTVLRVAPPSQPLDDTPDGSANAPDEPPSDEALPTAPGS